MRAAANVMWTGQEARAEPRFPLFLPATLRSGPSDTRVQLRNLSRSGALAESLRPPPPGRLVTLARERLVVEARVVWTRGIRFGLRFEQPIKATEMLVQLSRGR